MITVCSRRPSFLFPAVCFLNPSPLSRATERPPGPSYLWGRSWIIASSMCPCPLPSQAVLGMALPLRHKPSSCCTAAPPDLRSSPSLLNWTRTLIFLIISPVYLSLPRCLFAPSSCWSSTLWSQQPPCRCTYRAAPVHSSHCSAQTLPCPLQIPVLLCSIFFPPSSNWAIDSCFVLKVKRLSEFPQVFLI